MSDVYDSWKPLRNYLRHLDLNDALSVLRYYAVRRTLRITPPVPSDMELHPWVDRENSFLPWELEALAREVIIVCEEQSNPLHSLRVANDMAAAMTKLKAVENFIEEKYLNSKNIQHAFSVRLAHKQFKYQTDRPNLESVIRYSKIFGHPKMAPIVKSRTGLEPNQLFTIGAGLWGHYTKLYGMYYPLEELSLTGISRADYDRFLELYARPMETMKALLTDPSERHFDDTFFYGYHSLHAFPLILTSLNGQAMHVCPSPTLLYWKVTSGLYYDLCREKGFDNAFGAAFEDYIGASLEKGFADTKIKLYPGETNTKNSPHRCDWIIDREDSCLIIECKTKRLTDIAKTSLSDDDELFKQLGILGDGICQAYLSLNAYRQRLHIEPNYVFDDSKPAFVCVTTLEKWYLMGQQLEMLQEIVKEKVLEAGLDEVILTQSPFVVMSVTDLEKVAHLARSRSFDEIVGSYVKNEKYDRWEFASYLQDYFQQELKDYHYVFDDDIKDTYTVPIDISKRIADSEL